MFIAITGSNNTNYKLTFFVTGTNNGRIDQVLLMIYAITFWPYRTRQCSCLKVTSLFR